MQFQTRTFTNSDDNPGEKVDGREDLCSPSKISLIFKQLFEVLGS